MSSSEGGESRYRMPTPEQMKSAKRLVALYDYEPTLDEDADIPLVAGQVVFGVELQGEWWFGYNSQRAGIFPANYVEEEKPADDPEGGAAVPEAPAADDDSETSDEDAPPPAPVRSTGGSKPSAVDEEGPDPFEGEDDDDSDDDILVAKKEAASQRLTIQSVPGLNTQWAIADSIRFAHPVNMWNGKLAPFVGTKLILTNEFLIEAAFFSQELPELTIYPLYKLFVDEKTPIKGGFLKRGYLTIRSKYYFRNLSTTANGGATCQLVREERERNFTHTPQSRINRKKGADFVRLLRAALVQAKADLTMSMVEHMRTLAGYEQLYDPDPPHFDDTTKELVFAAEICKKVDDAFISYDDLKFTMGT